jgi:hypothetical protein
MAAWMIDHAEFDGPHPLRRPRVSPRGIAFRPSAKRDKASLPWKVIPVEELMTRDPPFIESGLVGHFSNLCRLECILALVK